MPRGGVEETQICSKQQMWGTKAGQARARVPTEVELIESWVRTRFKLQAEAARFRGYVGREAKLRSVGRVESQTGSVPSAAVNFRIPGSAPLFGAGPEIASYSEKSSVVEVAS